MQRKNILMLATAALAVLSCGCSRTDVDKIVDTPCAVTPLYRYMAEFGSLEASVRDSIIAADSSAIDIMMSFIGYDKKFEKELESKAHDLLNEDENKKRRLERRKDKEGEENLIAEEARDIDSLRAAMRVEMLDKWAEDAVVKMFTPAVEKSFPTLEPIEVTLGLMTENASALNIDFSDYAYYAVVWGVKVPVMSSGKNLFIALNMYLGENFAGYNGWPAFQVKMCNPKYMPYTIAETLLASMYPYERTETSTALSRMLYEGAKIYAILKIVPDATLADALGYTREQLEWLDSNYQHIWERIIGQDILYNTSEDVTDRLISPAPSTSIISPETPGRVGRYLGYRLVLNYMENNAKAQVTHLLTPRFYDDPSELVLTR